MNNNNHGSRERMQQQSMGRGNRMRGMFSGLKEKPKASHLKLIH